MNRHSNKKTTTGKTKATSPKAKANSESELLPTHDFTELCNLLNQKKPTSEHELYDLLTMYQADLEADMWKALEAPVISYDDFDALLRLVKKAHKQGRFDERLKCAVTTLKSFLGKEKFDDYLPKVVARGDASKRERVELRWDAVPINKQAYWKSRHLIYEIGDYYNLITADDSEQIQREGLKVYSRLRLIEADWKNIDLSEFDVRALREMVLFSGCRANELRRNGEPNQALWHFNWLFDFTSKYLSTVIPCSGTMANLRYNISVVLRDQERLDEAENAFSQTLVLYHDRAKARRANKDLDDALFTDRRVSMCVGLGFGWINLTRGQLKRAEHAITTALSLLAASDDHLISAYLTLLLGNVKRCRAGNNREQLIKAIEFIQSAEKTFEPRKQYRYLARVRWELSLSYNLLGEFDKSIDALAFVEEIAKQYAEQKWLANVSIQRSRILRKEGRVLFESGRGNNSLDKNEVLTKALDKLQQAVDSAETAISIAKRGGHVLPAIDALMARGQALFTLAEATEQGEESYVTARQDFQAALEKLNNTIPTIKSATSPNPKIASVCHLYIARCFVMERNRAQADNHFQQWRSLEAYVEHEWVRELANKTQEEIYKISKDFVLRANDESHLKYEEQLTKLRSWVFDQATRRCNGNMVEAAKLLGISRATLYQWFETSKIKRSGR